MGRVQMLGATEGTWFRWSTGKCSSSVSRAQADPGRSWTAWAVPNEGWEADVELHDGALWTKRTVSWTKGRRFVLVRMGATLWFLSMDGQLRGDV